MSTYEVVSPLGRRAPPVTTRAARPRTLDGATIGELSNHKFDSAFTFEVIENALLKRFPTANWPPPQLSPALARRGGSPSHISNERKPIDV